MENIDLEDRQVNITTLETVVDPLIGLNDRSTEEDFDPQNHIVEIDGTTPHSVYCRNCDLCEGMEW